MRRNFRIIIAVAIICIAGVGSFFIFYQFFGWRDTFPVDKANLGLVGTNPYFNLTPGYRLTYKEGASTLIRTVLDENKSVDGVTTRVVEDREESGGQLVEVTRDYFAIDKTTNDVYYFGEDVDEYEGGIITGHGGSWLSGVEGAQFGLMIPGDIKLGDKFYQEKAIGVAMDRAEVVGVSDTVYATAGTFSNCVHFKESSALEIFSFDDKWYAPNVGMVKDNGLVLTTIG